MPRKRSRNGCLSCKKLRIKCNEARPRCEYCLHTNRACHYPQDTDVEQVTRVRDVALFNRRAKDGLSNPDKYFTFDQLVSTAGFASPTAQLGISQSEFRLVSFFDTFCIPLFSFGVNMAVHNVWKNQVPSLFMSSSLVRNSVYSFAALNLFPLLGMTSTPELMPHDLTGVVRTRTIADLVDDDLSLAENQSSFYDRTSSYFNDALQRTNILIELKLKTAAMARESPSPRLAAELTISSILVYSYVCLHPFKVAPLISWNPEVPDIISISRGVRTTLNSCNPVLAESSFKGLMSLRHDQLVVPPLEHTTAPVIAALRDQLAEMIQGLDVLDSKLIRGHEALKESIYLLHECVAKCSFWNYPVPMFRWLIMLSDDFRDLLYDKNFFALRLLFVFSCYSVLSRFEIDGESNVWVDYIEWFRKYNEKLYGRHQWRYSLDEALHYICKQRICVFPFANFREMDLFDPEMIFMHGDSSATEDFTE